MKTQKVAPKQTTQKKVVSSRRGWYNDYLNHENAQYRMTFIEYKKLRQEGKIK